MDIFLSVIPVSARGIFKRAFDGNSRSSAIKAKCLDCCFFDRAEIGRCKIRTCLLWSYRPYQKDLTDAEASDE